MLFDDDFLATLRDDPVTGTLALCEKAFKNINPEDMEWSEDSYETLIEAYSLLVEIIDGDLLPIQTSYPSINGTSDEDCSKIHAFLKHVHSRITAEAAKLKVDSLRSKFRASLKSGFAYEFSQGDLDQVQNLLNELREQITNAHQLDKEHQQRLLRRLEKLQSELHKKVSDLDRFWGLIGDAGVVLGKLGNDAKPIVDRVREIADIVWQTQSRAEELPSGTSIPMLDHKPTRESDSV